MRPPPLGRRTGAVIYLFASAKERFRLKPNLFWLLFYHALKGVATKIL
jgi:hypothetical protein